MQKSKISMDPFVIAAITKSQNLSDSEKINFLKYIGYMTMTEKMELVSII